MKDELLRKHNGDAEAAAVELARGLMRGDPATFKAGYTLEDAVAAAVELFTQGPNGETGRGAGEWPMLCRVAAEVGRQEIRDYMLGDD